MVEEDIKDEGNENYLNVKEDIEKLKTTDERLEYLKDFYRLYRGCLLDKKQEARIKDSQDYKLDKEGDFSFTESIRRYFLKQEIKHYFEKYRRSNIKNLVSLDGQSYKFLGYGHFRNPCKVKFPINVGYKAIDWYFDNLKFKKLKFSIFGERLSFNSVNNGEYFSHTDNDNVKKLLNGAMTSMKIMVSYVRDINPSLNKSFDMRDLAKELDEYFLGLGIIDGQGIIEKAIELSCLGPIASYKYNSIFNSSYNCKEFKVLGNYYYDESFLAMGATLSGGISEEYRSENLNRLLDLYEFKFKINESYPTKEQVKAGLEKIVELFG